MVSSTFELTEFYINIIPHNKVLNTAKPGHSTDPVSAVRGKKLLGIMHRIASVPYNWCGLLQNMDQHQKKIGR